MIINFHKSKRAMLVIAVAMLLDCLSSTAWTTQEPPRPQTSEEERKRALDRLVRRAQENQPAPKPPVAAPFPQAQPGMPVPIPVPTPLPANTPNVPAMSNAPAAPNPQMPAVPPVASAAQRDSGKIVLNMENADLYDFINQIASTLGISPLVVDSEVKGTVNIISAGSMSKEDILPLFNLILKNNNAALVKQGDVYQIVPISSALKRGVDLIDLSASPAADKTESEKKQEEKPTTAKPKATNPPTQSMPTAAGPFQAGARKLPVLQPAPEQTASPAPRLATHVIRVEYVPVKDLVEPIKLFMTEGGVIMPYERLNMLILTDYSDSAARILDIIHLLDKSYLDPDLVDLVKINNNSSADVTEDLKKIFGAGTKESSTGIYFLSLDRLNAIFVMASSKRGLEEMRRWIKQLDAESGRNIQTYVYVVENATASNIAMMLSALYGGEGSSTNVSGGAASSVSGGGGSATSSSGRSSAGQTTPFGNAGSNMGTTGQYGSSSQFGSQSNNQGGYSSYGSGQMGGSGFGGSSYGGGQRLGPQLNTSRSITSQVLRGGEFSGLQETVRLVVDDINNSLIIQSTAADYAYILDTIKKMDVLPRQAIIDARIFEVQLTNDFSFGVNAALQEKTDGSKGEHSTGGDIGVTNNGISANTFAFVGNTRQIIARLNALRSKTKVKILEAPSVLALDGMQARINVGSEIPYQSGSYTSSVGNTTSLQYRDTGVTLIVLPRISASGSVTMDITQEVSDQGAAVDIGNNEKATSFKKSLVETSFTVKDGETVAIAGLITDNSSNSRTGVPFLSEIPILGSLFGSTTKNVTRTEQIILITPHVIRTPEKLEEATQDLRDSLRHTREFVAEEEQQRMDDLKDAQKDREKKQKKNQNQEVGDTKKKKKGSEPKE
jgi:general secretion pathway protein D